MCSVAASLWDSAQPLFLVRLPAACLSRCARQPTGLITAQCTIRGRCAYQCHHSTVRPSRCLMSRRVCWRDNETLPPVADSLLLCGRSAFSAAQQKEKEWEGWETSARSTQWPPSTPTTCGASEAAAPTLKRKNPAVSKGVQRHRVAC